MANNNLYVSLEEVMKALISLHVHTYEGFPKSGYGIDKEDAIKKLQELPTIDLGKIDEMIEEIKRTENNGIEYITTIRILELLKSRLFPKQ